MANVSTAALQVLKAVPGAEIYIKKVEGFKEKTYRDAGGVATIGYGFTEAMRKGITQRGSITRAEADKILREELLGQYGQSLQKSLRNQNLTKDQVGLLLGILWNVGPSLKTSKVMELINAGDVDGAANVLKSWKTTSKGKTIRGLVLRRAAEAEILRGRAPLSAFTYGKEGATLAKTSEPQAPKKPEVTYQSGTWGLIQQSGGDQPPSPTESSGATYYPGSWGRIQSVDPMTTNQKILFVGLVALLGVGVLLYLGKKRQTPSYGEVVPA